ncbi:hypothetical protein AMECASPLE_037631 [Ameca splendens]|uniref:Uncharacterized protein n=1 Tax=Ameca splendens TaxID=208324 RepID=A0ABV1AFV3_9TELE
MGGQAKGKKKSKTKRKDNRQNRDGGFVDLSPQERMKVRMHEKAKKKTAEKYSVQQLLEKVTLKTYHRRKPLDFILYMYFSSVFRLRNTWTLLILRWLAFSVTEL